MLPLPLMPGGGGVALGVGVIEGCCEVFGGGECGWWAAASPPGRSRGSG